jgi:hypothetical protein
MICLWVSINNTTTLRRLVEIGQVVQILKWEDSKSIKISSTYSILSMKLIITKLDTLCDFRLPPRSR